MRELQTETQKTRARPKRRSRFPLILLCLVFVTAVVFILTNRGLAPGRSSASRARTTAPTPKSEAQQTIEALDWIEVDLLPINEYSRPGDKLDGVNNLVVHYIGNPGTTAQQNRNFFANLAVTGETSASSNFIIGIDGAIIQCVPVDEIAYASNTRNNDTLSIECCHPDESGEFTTETYDALVRLTAQLCREFSLSHNDLIRHYDVMGKVCPKYYVENPDAWEAFKLDVRDAIAALAADADAA